jgi:hypothetical protein
VLIDVADVDLDAGVITGMDDAVSGQAAWRKTATVRPLISDISKCIQENSPLAGDVEIDAIALFVLHFE